MPPKFVFRKRNEQVQFECFMNRDPERTTSKGNPTCMQCEAMIGPERKRRQCSRSTCLHTPYCWQHTRSLLKLRVMRSMFLHAIGIDGLGLYAWDPGHSDRKTPVFRRGTMLENELEHNYYSEDELSPEELNERYDYHDDDCDTDVEPTAPYAIIREDRTIYDAACQRGIIAYANSVRRGQKRIIRQRRGRVTYYYANNMDLSEDGNVTFTKHIYHGDELLTDYGNVYWEGTEMDCNGQTVSTSSHTTTAMKVSGCTELNIPPYP